MPYSGGGGILTIVAGGGGGGGTTWDSANKTAHISLDATKLIATATTGVATADMARCTASHSSGKFYAEFTYTTYAGGTQMGVGIVDSSFSVGSVFVGGNTDGEAYYAQTSQTFFNGAGSGSNATAQGDVVCMAFDCATGHLWFRTNGGNWNANASANPSTDTLALTDLTGGLTFFPAVDIESGVGNVLTANFGASAYTFFDSTVTGFGNW